MPNIPQVYPCAYREHEREKIIYHNVVCLSLCIQGTFLELVSIYIIHRFIPVHTGNISGLLL